MLPRAVIIDTSNYYPHRDGNIAALDHGQVESFWVSAQFGRPVTKAWNAIPTGSFAAKATPWVIPIALQSPLPQTMKSNGNGHFVSRRNRLRCR